jgi:hypothetical protein
MITAVRCLGCSKGRLSDLEDGAFPPQLCDAWTHAAYTAGCFYMCTIPSDGGTQCLCWWAVDGTSIKLPGSCNCFKMLGSSLATEQQSFEAPIQSSACIFAVRVELPSAR